MAPEKITDSLLFSKLKGVRALSCQVWRRGGGGKTAFMTAPSETPRLWSGGGEGVRICWAQAEPG